ncbi:ATP-dependent DNA ligase [archaeon]|nr:ATP-dependent DNA ligase [archaeon]MBT4241857.1 ATP-dependent DNA ligase [archaeon]MBT4418404.1 ATP-dependent DNA ligase [archaeon]
MEYIKLCEIYEDLEKNSSRLKKAEILSEFLQKIKHSKNKDIIYLIQGKVFPDYSEKEFGISEQLCIKALAKSSGVSPKEITQKWKKLGDLGKVAEEVMTKKKQGTLFSHKLTTDKVLKNLQRLPDLVGRGTVDKKLSLISELLTSASGIEAKYIIRTLLGQLRIGVASGTIRDSIVETCFKEKTKENIFAVQDSYDKITDFALVFEKACKGIKELQSTALVPGNPLKAMLALKAESVEDAFKKVGKPAIFEYKYDGFRMMINKNKKGEIKIFTRRLDNVTNQFPDVVKYVKEHVKAKSFILDSEAVGYDRKTKKYKPFQDISQRIRRKHHIEELVKKLPIEVNVFDILYYEGKALLNEPFEKRTKLLRKIIKNRKYHLKTAHQLITSDVKKAEKFYKEALDDNQEGVMIKNMESEYRPGSRVGHMLKLKPAENELDLVITAAEYGKGKRVGAFASFTLSCYDEKSKTFKEIGKSSGLKEKSELGLSFTELTKKLKPLIIKEHGRIAQIKPKIVVTILYQNIQRSPTYNSGFGLRFPRIIQLRPDRHAQDAATLKEVVDDYKRHELKIHY